MPPKGTLKATAPKALLDRGVEADWKKFFTSAAKAVGFGIFRDGGRASENIINALAELGLANTAGEQLHVLVHRALGAAMLELAQEAAPGVARKADVEAEQLSAGLDYAFALKPVEVDGSFFKKPTTLPIVDVASEELKRWLLAVGAANHEATAVARRLPPFFTFALMEEWRKNARDYELLAKALDTPFDEAGRREAAWAHYAQHLEREVTTSVFGEPYGLRDIYVRLNAYFVEDLPPQKGQPRAADDDRPGHRPRCRRVVVRVADALTEWVNKRGNTDCLRVLSGGPGSGKSSVAKMLAVDLTRQGQKVVVVPLYQFNYKTDLVKAMAEFVKEATVLEGNPIDPDSPDDGVLLIFDGLDELANQGKGAATTARDFVSEVRTFLDRRTAAKHPLKVLISGRELVVQESESVIRNDKVVFNLLPLCNPKPMDGNYNAWAEGDEVVDEGNLLAVDDRDTWWRQYGEVVGKNYDCMPRELARKDLMEVTAQPLLNHLVAKSHAGGFQFTEDVNLNSIYQDLVKGVYHRAYDRAGRFMPLKKADLSYEEFLRVFEEVAVAAWHGGESRSTTISRIEKRCTENRLSKALMAMRDGAEQGATRLLAAFFFRRHETDAAGDPTFVFTHKSFGEYLAARRVVRLMELVAKQRTACEEGDGGWNQEYALCEWAKICGPAPLTNEIGAFLRREVALRDAETLRRWQSQLAVLMGHVLRQASPMELLLGLASFRNMLEQSRNAEGTLLMALNSCALITKEPSQFGRQSRTSFGDWWRTVGGFQPPIVEQSLSYTSLPSVVLETSDFTFCNLSHADLSHSYMHLAIMHDANLSFANLSGTHLDFANASFANCACANLTGASLNGANLSNAILEGANLTEAMLMDANLSRANLSGADLTRAKLDDANLSRANLVRADLIDANLSSADLTGANLTVADLTGANLTGANLSGANLEGSRLNDANLSGANLTGADLDGADLTGANRFSADFTGVHYSAVTNWPKGFNPPPSR